MDDRERWRLELIDQLNSMLVLAKGIFNRPNYRFNRGTYFGKTWYETMEVLQADGQATEELVKGLAKILIPLESIQNLRGIKAYFDQNNSKAWDEKVQNLISAKNEEEYDSLCYEFYIGSSLSQNKTIYFCNMDAKGVTQESLCEYFVEPRLFIECKNLFGTTRTAVENNIRKANAQIRSSIEQIPTPDQAIGAAFIDLPEKINIESADEIRNKMAEVISRLRQCNYIHFLGVSFMNIIDSPNDAGIDVISEMKLIVNPQFADLIFDDSIVSLFIPTFRYVAIPHDGVFDVFDFIDKRTVSSLNFDEFFGVRDDIPSSERND
ncbi:hypothetical protein CA600_06375 [Paenibacillus sp. VTT E-133280]|uniref:hypothetical protein n=1 Tax=Paenibacillus sp. VTT E-133280 TaxID=1986222 RepID=UPI000BA10002|nr:hypothetical protein [Paenibacillus sp. VTT E-133280]OZQ68434.1 hypothetical protein CA600_06375 [Paenibacillus sp. VTT E-133280]